MLHLRGQRVVDCHGPASLSMNPCDMLLIRHRERSEAIQRFGSEFLDGHGPSGLAMTAGGQVHGPWAFPERKRDLAMTVRGHGELPFLFIAALPSSRSFPFVIASVAKQSSGQVICS
ncbi:MAG TPA: hypothetical protein VFN29_07175 [Chiayiivirga sp.]|nr:hypothetical protein [Chiayiivirga sp.]